jgi:cytidylate kinase
VVITIDGPSGAGKSTVSKALARKLNFAYLDSGALYRAVGLAATWDGMEQAAESEVAPWLSGVDLSAKPEGDRFWVLIDGRDVEPFIRNEEIGSVASRLSAMACVRGFLLEVQRRAAKMGSLVAEGRDMGTVIFPEAEAKFFVTANDEERANRRLKELLPESPELSLEEVLKQIRDRDKRDSSRDLSPLAPAKDAVVLDTSAMSFEQVLENLLCHVNKTGIN